MNVYELINPSDPYTLEAESDEIAAVAGMLVGEGHYAVQKDGIPALPLFMFDDAESVESWWREKHHGRDLGESLRLPGVAACLRSFVIGDRKKWSRLRALMPEEKRAEFDAEWHDAHRSSLNDIGERARQFADRVDEMTATSVAATRREEGET